MANHSDEGNCFHWSLVRKTAPKPSLLYINGQSYKRPLCFLTFKTDYSTWSSPLWHDTLVASLKGTYNTCWLRDMSWDVSITVCIKINACLWEVRDLGLFPFLSLMPWWPWASHRLQASARLLCAMLSEYLAFGDTCTRSDYSLRVFWKLIFYSPLSWCPCTPSQD